MAERGAVAGREAVAARFTTLILGDAGDMACVGSGEASLVLTSPPYFPRTLEKELAGSRKRQVRPADAWAEIELFARGLEGVFREMARVVGAAGICCIETKDLKYGDFRLPLAALHGALARESGLWIRSSFTFRSAGIKPSHLPAFVDDPRVGNFRTLDASTMLVCSHPSWEPRSDQPLALSRRERLDLISPHWRVMPARRGRIHEHQTPPAVVRRMIELYSEAGELVVDPFAGSAQVLRIARELGRNAIGYECDAVRHRAAQRTLEEAGEAPRRGRRTRKPRRGVAR